MKKAFTGERAFLSSFHPVEGGVEYEGALYPTVENAFQAAKTLDPAERKPFEECSPARAKMLGRHVALRPGWDYARVEVMKELVRAKFRDPALREKLLATGEEPLVETNAWHDNYWGVCGCSSCQKKGTGLNWLGRILMAVRKEARG